MINGGGSDWDDVFLNAALEPEQWQQALATMARATGSSHGQLIGVGGPRDLSLNIISEFDWTHVERYMEMGANSADNNFRIAAAEDHLRRGFYDPLLHEVHYDQARGLLASTAYSDWCDDIDIPFGCQTNLVVDQLGLIGFAVLRSRRDGITTPAQRRIFARAAAAARRAVRLQERLEGEQAKLLAGAFEAIGIAAFIIDRRGNVRSYTASAEEHLSSGAIRLRHGRIEAPGRPLSLGQAVAALTDDPGEPHVRFALDRAGSAVPLYMEGFRLPQRANSLGALPHAILLFRSPVRDRAGIATFLSALHGLTAAEADIAMRLYEGKARSQIAAEREVSTETLRSQVKAIYLKLGVSQERELLSLLAPIMQ